MTFKLQGYQREREREREVVNVYQDIFFNCNGNLLFIKELYLKNLFDCASYFTHIF